MSCLLVALLALSLSEAVSHNSARNLAPYNAATADPTVQGNTDPSGLAGNVYLFICPSSAPLPIDDPFGINLLPLVKAVPWSLRCKPGYYDNGLGRHMFTGGASPSLTCAPTTFSGATQYTNCYANSTPAARYGGYNDPYCGLTAGEMTTCYCVSNFVSYQRSMACLPCPVGTFGAVAGLTTSACSGTCAAGRYGNVTALKSAQCAGNCTAGYYCPAGSTSPTQLMCPPGSYCPIGSPSPLPCPAGYFCSAAQASPFLNICPLGYFCAAGSSSPAACSPTLATDGSFTVAPVLGTPGSWSWACSADWYGASTTRVCSTSDGTFSGAPFSCSSCSLLVPAAPANANAVVHTVPYVWRYTCLPGYYGGPLELTCNSVTGSFGAARLSCTRCPGNATYCPGNDDGGMRTCPAGTWGGAAPGKLTADCSGLCTAGFYCPAGSSSSTAVPCGGVGYFCPAGSSAPQVVPDNFYSTPTTASATMRTGYAACPANSQCAGGVVLPGVSWGSSCTPATPLFVAEASAGAFIGSAPFNITTPGSSGGVVVSIVSVNGTAGCVLKPGVNISWDAATSRLRVVPGVSLLFSACQFGAVVNLVAARVGDSLTFATCAVMVNVTQVARVPVITDCGPRVISERLVTGSAVSFPSGIGAGRGSVGLTATSGNVGTVVLWTINATTGATAPALPFSIGACDGILTSLAPLIRTTRAVYTLPIIATNDGRSLGIGLATASCVATVTVVASPLPPAVTTSAFSAPDLSPAGTKLGNVGAYDIDGYTIVWISIVPNSGNGAAIIAVDSRGNVTLAAPATAYLTGVYTYSATLNVSTAYATALLPITLTLAAVATPPITSGAVFSINELSPSNAYVGTLSATSPSGANLSFSFTTGFGCSYNASLPCFNVSGAGVVAVARGGGSSTGGRTRERTRLLIRMADTRQRRSLSTSCRSRRHPCGLMLQRASPCAPTARACGTFLSQTARRAGQRCWARPPFSRNHSRQQALRRTR